MCQCPLGLLPHFYDIPFAQVNPAARCQCPLGLLPHFYVEEVKDTKNINNVSMPSRAVTSFLHAKRRTLCVLRVLCQCPLGLLPHFYDL